MRPRRYEKSSAPPFFADFGLAKYTYALRQWERPEPPTLQDMEETFVDPFEDTIGFEYAFFFVWSPFSDELDEPILARYALSGK